MKWVSHVAIAGALAVPFDPMAVPAAVLGSTAPDWLEWVLAALGHKVKHRTVTHYVSGWVLLALFGAFVWDFWHHTILWFAVGGLSHVLADAFTIQGVPLGPWSDRRIHLLGGRIKSGSGAEFVIVALVIAVSALATWQTRAEFAPFFYDWGGLYERGIIDGVEWRANRFRFL